MNRSNWRYLVLTCMAGLALALAACGGDSGGGEAESESADGTLRVGFVADVAGLNDRSFNYLGAQGMKRAESELGVETRILTSKTNADYVPNLSSLARDDYDLVIASGFNFVEALTTVSKQFPDTNFAILDISVDMVGGAPNVLGLPFEQDQASYLAGYLAALFAEDKYGAGAVLGSIGGEPIPPVENWMHGFSTGVAKAAPNMRVIEGYSQSFGDPAPCKQLAENQMGQGAKVIFQVAGGCGIGVITAVGQTGLYAIGTDADQSYLGDQVLTSAVKKSDVAVFDTIKGLQDGEFEGGTDRLFTIKDGAVGLGKISSDVPANVQKQTEALEAKLKAGEVEVPTANNES